MTLEDIALPMTQGVGIKSAVHLLECFGTAERVFAATVEELTTDAEMRADIAHNIVSRSGFRAAEKELDYCRRHNITPLASTDEAYPRLLREIPDYPHILYVKGNVAALSQSCVSMVGTRETTPYGQLMANRLVEGLAQRVGDLCIVSGLAYGIDIAAHRAALAAGVATVAVVANALPDVTPVQHTAVAREIIAQGGAIVSEMHSQTKQNGTGFLARNRIIAALSAGCVVVESPENGGSLATARFADDYHRSVMAVPGRATDASSKGANHLIATRKAQLILSAGDIIRELMWDVGDTPAAPHIARTLQLTADEQGLLGCFRTNDPIPTESLVELSGLSLGELATLLLTLELAGAVRQLPGDRYMKLV